MTEEEFKNVINQYVSEIALYAERVEMYRAQNKQLMEELQRRLLRTNELEEEVSRLDELIRAFNSPI